MKNFNHVGSKLQDLLTEILTERGIMLHPMGISIYQSPHFYQTSPKLLYRSGESVLEKMRPERLRPKPQEEEPAYIISVSPISKMNMDT